MPAEIEICNVAKQLVAEIRFRSNLRVPRNNRELSWSEDSIAIGGNRGKSIGKSARAVEPAEP